MRAVWRLYAAAAALVVGGMVVGTSAAHSTEADQRSYWRETFSGGDVTRDVWLLYSGITLAPTSDIYGNGIRLRASGGYGNYNFQDQSNTGRRRELTGTINYVEALIGYQQRFGELTAKAFVGIAAIDHVVAPNSVLLTQGMEYGPKGALELWLNLGSSAWTSLDLNWTSAHQTYASRWRIGYRVLPTASVGLEAGVTGNLVDTDKLGPTTAGQEPSYMSGRVGAFARYEWNGGEISISGGLSNSAYEVGDTGGFDQIYGTVNWLTRF